MVEIQQQDQQQTDNQLMDELRKLEASARQYQNEVSGMTVYMHIPTNGLTISYEDKHRYRYQLLTLYDFQLCIEQVCGGYWHP